MTTASVRAPSVRPLGALLAAPPAAVFRVVQELWMRPSLLVVLTLVLLCIPVGAAPEEEASQLAPGDIAAFAVVALVAVRGLTGHPAPLLRGSVVAAAFVVAGAALVATVAATDTELSLVGAVRLVEIFVAVPLAVALSLRTRSDLILILGAVMAIGIVQGGIGVYQYATGTGAGFNESNIRAVGTFGSYDIMTMALVVTYALLAALAVALAARGRVRLVAGAACLFLVIPLAMSLSRGSWLAAAIAALAVLAAFDFKRTLLVGGVCALLALPVLGVTQSETGVIGSRLTSLVEAIDSPDRSVRDRYALWATAVQIWRDHPVTGVGPKNFSLWRDTYAPLSLSSSSDISDPTGGFRQVELLSPHSLYLLVLSEQGALGIGALLAFLVILGAGAGRRLRATRSHTLERIVGLFAVAVLVRFAVAGLWSDIGGPGTTVSAILLGVLVWFAAGARTSREQAPATYGPGGAPA